MLNITNFTNKQTIKIIKNEQKYKNNVHFGSIKDVFTKNNKTNSNDEKSEKKKKLIKTSAIIAIALATLGILLNYRKNQKINKETETLYNTIMSALDEAPELKQKIENKIQELNLNKINDFADNNVLNLKALKSLEYLAAMDCVPEAQQKLPNLITFNKMQDNAFFNMYGSIFGRNNPNLQMISYDGNIKKVLDELAEIKGSNPTDRLFVVIEDKQGYNFGKDIRKNKTAKNLFEEFFKSIKDKKISFVTSNPFLMKLFNKLDNNPERLNIGYKITNLKNFTYNCI